MKTPSKDCQTETHMESPGLLIPYELLFMEVAKRASTVGRRMLASTCWTGLNMVTSTRIKICRVRDTCYKLLAEQVSIFLADPANESIDIPWDSLIDNIPRDLHGIVILCVIAKTNMSIARCHTVLPGCNLDSIRNCNTGDYYYTKFFKICFARNR